MKISFVGAGNVAWHLAQAFENAGHVVNEVYSRDSQNARLLTTLLYDATIQPDLNFAESESALIVIAAADDALAGIIERIVLPDGVMLVHTSGTQSLAELQRLVGIYSDVPVRTGVLYPLQTFTKGVPLDYAQIPFCIEATDADTEQELTALARSVSTQVYRVDSEERQVLHIGAVFACNFTNHLLTIAHDLLAREQLDFTLLKPLIRETCEKALASTDPALAQTGPARRNDWSITSQHLAYLQPVSPEWTGLYRQLTESIRLRHFGMD
ncbi:F420-dependent NADP oxidoreductase [Rhabdobacter roseus]|uniref:Putative short-subunit dehydrogenase-like oxidoreductase (DUF2520 family) n=1 Tax=Rhabdobacter roseus TaxID=1655419 RepID=A0A840TUV7_9BACT|nr:Rossmann-like and DUF2520 domain-containing protein [Rhabdobacter roseus]MBB5285053.1 putative short-subunit dehydrogenase-like oxidoreductase (DUF2520 family) [Rhabdobacter roseus]